MIDDSCHWTVGSDACNALVSDTVNRCPAAGFDWNERAAETVGAGAAAMTLSNWQKDHPSDTWW